MKVSTRKGYAKKGSGDEVGNTCLPQNMLAAVIAKRIDPIMPTTRTQTANSFGTLVSRRAAHHNAVPAANEGTLPSAVVAFPVSMTLDAHANTRNPAATISFPFLKKCSASSAVATIKPTPSIAHKAAWRLRAATNVPAIPKTPPSARPITATMFADFFILAGYHIPHADPAPCGIGQNQNPHRLG